MLIHRKYPQTDGPSNNVIQLFVFRHKVSLETDKPQSEARTLLGVAFSGDEMG